MDDEESGNHDETLLHVLTCMSPTVILQRQKHLEPVQTWLRRMDTRWDVEETIVSFFANLSPYSSFTAAMPVNSYDESLLSCATQQDGIGALSFLRGFTAVGWEHLMSSYYDEIESSRTGRSWSAGLIKRIFEFAHLCWKDRNEHKYEKDAFGRLLADESKLLERVRFQISLGSQQLPAHLQHLVPESTDIVLRKSRTALLSWLHHMEMIRSFFDEMEDREQARQRTFLHAWLQPRM